MVKFLVTLDQPDEDAGYTVASAPRNQNQITVTDFEIPEITFFGNSAPTIVAGLNAVFTLDSDIQPWQDIVVEYTPTNALGSFLDTTVDPSVPSVSRDSGEIRKTIPLTFEGTNTFRATFELPTADDLNATTGRISVRLNPDSENTPIHYKLSATDSESVATVIVNDPPVPLIKIRAGAISEINEGESVTINLDTDTNPERPLSIKYTLTDASGIYLDTTDGDSGMTRILKTTFTEIGQSGRYTTTFTIPTNAPNEVDDADGSIVLTLDTITVADGYTMSTDPALNSHTVMVKDVDIPVISIENAPETIAGDMVRYTLTAKIPPRTPIILKYRPVDDLARDENGIAKTNNLGNTYVGDFLDDTDQVANQDWEKQITFTLNENNQLYQAILEVPTQDDRTVDRNFEVTSPNYVVHDEPFGSIITTLKDDTTPAKLYTLSQFTTLQSASAEIVDSPNPELTISTISSSVTEGNDAVFLLTSSKNPLVPLHISYTANEEKNNNRAEPRFLHESQYEPNPTNPGTTRALTLTQILTFRQIHTSAPWTALLRIQLQEADGQDAEHSKLRITVLRANSGATYSQGRSGGNVLIDILDLEVPEIKILDAPDLTSDGTAMFTIESSIQPWKDLTIRYKPEETTGSFLDTNDHTVDMINEQVVNFTTTNGKTTGILEIETIDDTVIDPGLITITLEDTDTDPIEYVISNEAGANTANVVIYDTIPSPTLSIEASSVASIEGNSTGAQFIVKSNREPDNKEFIVTYNIEQIAGDYLASGTNFNTDESGANQRPQTEITFTRESAGSRIWIAPLNLPLRPADEDDAIHGMVRVTLKSAFSGYPIDEDPATEASNTATVTVYDQQIPVISIKDASETLASNMAIFTLEADIQPIIPLTIRFKPENETGKNYLNFTTSDTTYSSTDIWESEVTFAPDLSSTEDPKPIIGTFSIPTQHNRGDISGNIEVTLSDDDAEDHAKEYTADTTEVANSSPTRFNHIGMVNVIDVPVPVLKIADIANPVDEVDVSDGTTQVSFEITATKNPKRDLVVRYTPENMTGTFLDTTVDPSAPTVSRDSGEIRNSAPISFTPKPGSSTGEYVGNLIVDIVGNDIDNENGVIEVTLNDPVANTDTITDDYTVSTTGEDDAVVTIKDDEIPLITIANANETVAGHMARFTLTSNLQPWQGIKVQFTPENTSNEYLDQTIAVSGMERESTTLTFSDSDGSNFTDILEIPTMDDDDETAGEITVTLSDDADPKDYTIDTAQIPGSSPARFPHKATVQVVDVPQPTLTIADIATPVDEGEIANFVVTATENPKQDLRITYTVENTSTNKFYHVSDGSNSEQKTGDFEFTDPDNDSVWTTTIPVQTQAIAGDVEHGSISVTLDSVTAVHPATPAGSINADPDEKSADVTVHDTTTPEISVFSNPDTNTNTEIEIILQSDILPWQTLSIRYKPVNTTGEFLTFGSYQSDDIWESDVTFETDENSSDDPKPIIGKLIVPIQYDPINNTGTITVNFHDDDTNIPVHYNPPANPATISVSNAPRPELSIAVETDSIDEGGDANGNAKFLVSTMINPGIDPLPITYTPTHTFREPSDNFLNTAMYTIDPANPSKSITLEFTRLTGPVRWVSEILIPLRDKDGKDTDHGTLMLELDQPATNARYTIDSANDDATIQINDFEIPRVTITEAPATYAGQTAGFILTSHIQPWQPITIHYKPIMGTGDFFAPSAGTLDTATDSAQPITFAPEISNPPVVDPPSKAILPIPTQN